MKNNNNKKLTVSIGISAYNEEANIAKLIENIFKQKTRNFVLEKVILISDKSTDNTDALIMKYKSKKIVFMRNKRQLGKALTQNIISRISNSDILVIFDADVLPKNRKVLESLVEPFYANPNLGIAGGRPAPLASKNFVEKIVNTSVSLKEEIYVNIRNSRNIFLCHGRVRAFGKKFYKSFKWKRVAGEDAYSYLMCISKGWDFIYIKNAVVNYRSPNTISDHLKQSTRFMKGNTRMKKHFPQYLVEQEYSRPFLLGLWYLLKGIVKNPIEYSAYIVIYLYAKLVALTTEDQPGTWVMSNTTKQLN